jgi:hypothetical protein
MNTQSGGIISGGFDFADMADADLFASAARLLKVQDALAKAIRANETEIRKACLAYAERAGMWGVNPDILRRELKLRGYYSV